MLRFSSEELQVVNFSHPLTEEQKEELIALALYNEKYGGEYLRVNEEIIRVQIDLEKEIAPQIEDIYKQYKDVRGFYADLIVPPALAAVSFPFGAFTAYAQSDAMLPKPAKYLVLKSKALGGYKVADIVDVAR